MCLCREFDGHRICLLFRAISLSTFHRAWMVYGVTTALAKMDALVLLRLRTASSKNFAHYREIWAACSTTQFYGIFYRKTRIIGEGGVKRNP